MRTVDVTTAEDPRLGDYRGLTDVSLRRRTEPELGLFIAEGQLVIDRALAAGYAPRSVLTSPRWLLALEPVLPPDTDVYVGSEEFLREITGFHVHRGALASMHRRALPTAASVLAAARRVVVLEDVNTHTNVGSIFRAAAALGMDAVLLSPECADPLYRRSVRVSMGAVFALPYARLEVWPGGLDDLATSDFRLLALTPDPSARALDEVHLTPADRAAVLFGAEGSGLTSATLARTEPVRIPMSAGIDSLNVAAAAAVAFWAFGRH